ncbi:MAG: hypothetical protein V3V04_05630 [Rhizobiaceae bacterium]
MKTLLLALILTTFSAQASYAMTVNGSKDCHSDPWVNCEAGDVSRSYRGKDFKGPEKEGRDDFEGIEDATAGSEAPESSGDQQTD